VFEESGHILFAEENARFVEVVTSGSIGLKF
jgi:hypothetical protein